MKCLICKKSETVKFLDDYKLEIKEDIKFFHDLKIYNSKVKNNIVLKKVHQEY